jgi:hypothetical protein
LGVDCSTILGTSFAFPRIPLYGFEITGGTPITLPNLTFEKCYITANDQTHTIPIKFRLPAANQTTSLTLISPIYDNAIMYHSGPVPNNYTINFTDVVCSSFFKNQSSIPMEVSISDGNYFILKVNDSTYSGVMNYNDYACYLKYNALEGVYTIAYGNTTNKIEFRDTIDNTVKYQYNTHTGGDILIKMMSFPNDGFSQYYFTTPDSKKHFLSLYVFYEMEKLDTTYPQSDNKTAKVKFYNHMEGFYVDVYAPMLIMGTDYEPVFFETENSITYESRLVYNGNPYNIYCEDSRLKIRFEKTTGGAGGIKNTWASNALNLNTNILLRSINDKNEDVYFVYEFANSNSYSFPCEIFATDLKTEQTRFFNVYDCLPNEFKLTITSNKGTFDKILNATFDDNLLLWKLDSVYCSLNDVFTYDEDTYQRIGICDISNPIQYCTASGTILEPEITSLITEQPNIPDPSTTIDYAFELRTNTLASDSQALQLKLFNGVIEILGVNVKNCKVIFNSDEQWINSTEVGVNQAIMFQDTPDINELIDSDQYYDLYVGSNTVDIPFLRINNDRLMFKFENVMVKMYQQPTNYDIEIPVDYSFSTGIDIQNIYVLQKYLHVMNEYKLFTKEINYNNYTPFIEQKELCPFYSLLRCQYVIHPQDRKYVYFSDKYTEELIEVDEVYDEELNEMVPIQNLTVPFVSILNHNINYLKKIKLSVINQNIQIPFPSDYVEFPVKTDINYLDRITFVNVDDGMNYFNFNKNNTLNVSYIY